MKQEIESEEEDYSPKKDSTIKESQTLITKIEHDEHMNKDSKPSTSYQQSEMDTNISSTFPYDSSCSLTATNTSVSNHPFDTNVNIIPYKCHYCGERFKDFDDTFDHHRTKHSTKPLKYQNYRISQGDIKEV